MMRALALLIVMLLALSACGDNPPPTQIVIVISPTPEGTLSATDPATSVATVTAEGTTPAQATAFAQATASAEAATPQPSGAAPTSSLPASQPIIQPGAFPTTTVEQLAVAEQMFEGGQMFWIRYNRQIWVLIASEDDPNAGDWFCFNDTFVEGEPETDQSLTPPDPALFQPRRGFGKLWRTHEDLKDHLGWATSSEFELTSTYTYLPGGYVQGGTYQPGPGEHRLTTYYNASVSFFESDIRGDCLGGTWKLTEAP